MRDEAALASEAAAFPTPPTLPGRRRVHAPPARQPLSRELVVSTALAVLDSEGLDAVSMRRVAAELGTGAASLYVYVANKDELYELMLDHVAAEFAPVEPDPERWQEQVLEFAVMALQVMTEHRDIARVAIGHVPISENALRASESLLGILRAGRLPDQVVAWAADNLALFIMSTAYEQSLFMERGTEEHQAYFQELHAYMGALPADRFPHTIALADAMGTGDGADRFGFAIETYVRGLATYAEPSS